MTDHLGGWGLYEVIRDFFDCDVATALLGSTESLDGLAQRLQDATDYAVRAHDLDRWLDDFFKDWELSDEDAFRFLDDWRAAVDAALQERKPHVSEAGR